MPVGGFFYSHNRYSHSAEDDPIVFPGQPGASHLHDFAGRTKIDAHSRPADLLSSPSSNVGAKLEQEGGTYWVPALWINGEHIIPIDFSARYGLGPTSNPERLATFPPGFSVVAGRTRQTVQWNLEPPPRPAAKDKLVVPQPDGIRGLVCKITFPDLWDGVVPDAADWTSHTAYSKRKVIPDGWYAVPQLQLKIRYGKDLPTIDDVGLGSPMHLHDPATMHADFMNTWNQDRLEALVAHCIRGRRNCGESATGPQPPS